MVTTPVSQYKDFFFKLIFLSLRRDPGCDKKDDLFKNNIIKNTNQYNQNIIKCNKLGTRLNGEKMD